MLTQPRLWDCSLSFSPVGWPRVRRTSIAVGACTPFPSCIFITLPFHSEFQMPSIGPKSRYRYLTPISRVIQILDPSLTKKRSVRRLVTLRSTWDLVWVSRRVFVLCSKEHGYHKDHYAAVVYGIMSRPLKWWSGSMTGKPAGGGVPLSSSSAVMSSLNSSVKHLTYLARAQHQ